MACELAAYFYLEELSQKPKALELFLLAHEKYHEWGAFGKCTSLFEFVSRNFTSIIGSGLTLFNTTDSMGQEAAVAAPNVTGGLFSLTNTNVNMGQETAAPAAAPNVDDGDGDGLLSSLDDVLQRYSAS